MAEQAPLACNVTYTKTIRTITLEPTGNVTHVETFNYTIPCAEAPALPPAGAPDSAEPTVTRTTRTLPHAPAGQAGGPDAPDGVASPDGAPGPRADSTVRETRPPPDSAETCLHSWAVLQWLASPVRRGELLVEAVFPHNCNVSGQCWRLVLAGFDCRQLHRDCVCV